MSLWGNQMASEEDIPAQRSLDMSESIEEGRSEVTRNRFAIRLIANALAKKGAETRGSAPTSSEDPSHAATQGEESSWM